MSRNTVLRKRFFSTARESRWLNRLGEKGYRLWALKDHKYSFGIEEGKTFRYTVEWQDCATESEESRRYILEKAEADMPVCAQRSLWLYFISGRQAGYSKEALKKNRARYRNPFLFFLILTLICASLAVYHIHSIPFLQEQGMTITVPSFKGNENPVLDLLLRLVYGLWLAVYNYFMLFGRFLGDTLATAVVSVLAPLGLTFFILCLVWGCEWIRWLKIKADPPADEPEQPDAEDGENDPDEPDDAAGPAGLEDSDDPDVPLEEEPEEEGDPFPEEPEGEVKNDDQQEI